MVVKVFMPSRAVKEPDTEKVGSEKLVHLRGILVRNIFNLGTKTHR